jgi:hypothetical protein
MKSKPGRPVFCILFGAALLLGPSSSPGSKTKAAIVCFLQGSASALEPGQAERKALGLYDWLSSGTTVETGPGAKLVIAFSNGSRYELGEKAAVVLGPGDLSSRSGPVKKLEPVAVTTQMLALAGDSQPGSRLGGIRLRSSKRTISNLYPNEGDALLPDQAVLTFEPLPDIEKYRVEVEDEQGRDLLSVETSAPRVAVTPGVLKPGVHYYWQVRALEKDDVSTVAYAAFVTPTEEEARLWRSFRAQVGSSRDAASLLLLARFEMNIGLRKESCETLKEALSLSPGNEGIKEMIVRAGCEQRP